MSTPRLAGYGLLMAPRPLSDSDIVHFEVLGTHYIVLNSAKAAQDLMVKRGIKYSGRPPFVYTIDL